MGRRKKFIYKRSSFNFGVLNLENSKIKTEPQLLLRIMENLITNAVNYSVKGTSINIKVEEINGMLKISVINDVSPNLNVNWNMVTSKFYREIYQDE